RPGRPPARPHPAALRRERARPAMTRAALRFRRRGRPTGRGKVPDMRTAHRHIGGMAAIALAIALATGIAAAGPAHAATELRARASQATLDEGDTFDLLLRAAGDPPSAAPDLSVLAKDFDVVGTRQSQRLSVVNGRSEASVDWIVTLSPRSTGALTIPAIRAGDATSEPIAIDVRPASASPRATGGSGSQAGRGTAASP